MPSEDASRSGAPMPRVVKGDQKFDLDRETFRTRMLARAYDPAFEAIPGELERVIDVAWKAYHEYRKSPRMQPAGPEFADPAFELPVEWLETVAMVRQIRSGQYRRPDEGLEEPRKK